MSHTCSVRVVLSLLATAAVLASATLGAGVQEPPQGPTPQFRLGVELVPLSITATDAVTGRYVSDLTKDDFVVLEDGRPQDIVFFSRTDARLAVSLLIDSSGSMTQRLALAQHAAGAFVDQLRPGDTVRIIDFNDRVDVVQPFTADRPALERALRSITSGGLTSLYNAVYIALRTYDTDPQPVPASSDAVLRHVIVVLSDGEDTTSLLNFDVVLDAAKRSQSVIYSIGLALDPVSGPEPANVRIFLEDPRFILRELARETGGRLLLTDRAEELDSVYGEIADELANQYVLGYEPPPGNGGEEWRSIGVRVGRPNVQARTRPGYYAAATPVRAAGPAARR